MTEPVTGAGPDAPPPPAPRRRRFWRVAAVVVASSLGAAAVAAAFVHVPYVIVSPGDATPLESGVVTINDAHTYPHHGQLLYLTVRVTNTDPNVWRWLFAQLDHDVSVEKKSTAIGCASYAESARLNDLLMEDSQDVAKAVALRRLGYHVAEEASRAVIIDVECGGPAQGRLMQGDIITAVDGHPVAAAKDVRPLVVAHRPGARVRITVLRGSQARTVTVRAGRRGHEAFLGIVTQTVAREHVPLDIRIDTQRVSGPSAGLAFTLAIIDELTPGDLTGGRRVAVTGTIEPDGSVGDVGGIAQKTVTARQNGASIMLVPADEASVARDHADGMRIITVRTVADALAALRRAGGAPVPPVPSSAGSPSGGGQ